MGEVWIRESKKGVLRIRLANAGDDGAIRNLHRLFNLGAGDKILLKYSGNVSNNTLVVEADGRLIGFAKYWAEKEKGADFYYFHRAGVEPDFRREKIYTAFFLLRIKYSGGRHFEVTPSEEEAKAVRPAVDKFVQKLGLTLEITKKQELVVHVPENIPLQELWLKIDSFLTESGWRKTND